MSSFNFGVLATLATTLFGLANAHLMLQSPVPFDQAALDNSPLENKAIGSPGSNYPCKVYQGGGSSYSAGSSYSYKIDQVNKMSVGQDIPLSFKGSAVHGGGTCQLAITLDKEPTPSSEFKIIQVYEGGCPSKSDTETRDDYSFKIPEGFPNAEQAVFAWVWNNRIGNREIYMNCAPISITGGSDNKDVYNSLPNLYVIALPSSDCAAVESKDLKIPNPGKNVIVGGLKDAVPATGPGCAKAAAAQLAGVSGNGGSSGGNSSSSASASSYGSPAATSSSSDSGSYTQSSASYGPGSSSASGSSSSAASPTGSSSGMVTVITSAQPTGSAYPTLSLSSAAGIYGPASGSPAAAPTGYSSGSSSSSGSSCSDNGSIVCNGPTQFGICNQGSINWQPVAPGTTCANGAIQRRDGALARRHIRGSTAARQIREGAWALRKESLGIAENGE